MKRIIFIYLTLLSGMLFFGCKPTEKNYKAAYDAAKARREATVSEHGIGGFLQNDETLSIRVVEGDSVWVSHERVGLRDAEGNPVKTEPVYGVGVAVFRMPTNAVALKDDLLKRGYEASLATDGRDKWFVVSGLYSELGEAAKEARRFRDLNPSFIFVGLPSPVILYIR